MGDRLTPNILRLFVARAAIPYLAPLDCDPAERQGPQIAGVGDLVALLRNHDPGYVRSETLAEARCRKLAAREACRKLRLATDIPLWNPSAEKSVTSDPFKTLFVARLNYSTTEKILAKEFEFYGPVKSVKLVKAKETGKSRGYAFIEFERERDMRAAYRDIDGQRLDGNRIVVDVERGRTVKGWLPRRLGGGLGHTRYGEKLRNQTYHGRDTSVYGRTMIAIPQSGNMPHHDSSGHHPPQNSGHPSRFPRPRSRSPPRPRKRSRSRIQDTRPRERERVGDRGDRDRDRDRERERDRNFRHERRGLSPPPSSMPRHRESRR